MTSDHTQADPVSWVEHRQEKSVLMVRDSPFSYFGTQISPHRLEYFGWSVADMGKLFAAAAEDGFSVLAVPVLWNWLQPQPETWDWSKLAGLLDHAIAHRIQIELLWFGSDVCSVSHSSEGCPDWVIDRFTKVRTADGREYTARDFNYVTYRYETFLKLDKADLALLAAEKTAISAMLRFVRTYLEERSAGPVVIGVQLLNEPAACRMRDNRHVLVPDLDRSYSDVANQRWADGSWEDAQAFSVDVLWNYLEGLGQAVKHSEYPVWTRVNCNRRYEGSDFIARVLSLNEHARSTAGTSIDFFGDDPYIDDAEWVFEYGRTSIFTVGNNVPMITENSGTYENTDRLVIAALSGNAWYNIWELASSGDLEGETGFYEVRHADRSIRPKRHQPRIRSLNRLLRRHPELATHRSGSSHLAFLNPLCNPMSDSSHYVGGTEIRYRTVAGGAGIAVQAEQELHLSTTAEGEFLMPWRYLHHRPLWLIDHTGTDRPISQDDCVAEHEQIVIQVPAYSTVRIGAQRAPAPEN